MQTVTWVHVCFVLLDAQSLGTIATICARAPNELGPAGVSPNSESLDRIGNAWFWVALSLKLLAWPVFISVSRVLKP